jgi:DNA-binding winged helix-turn-helix (wHTH) protein/TolB-like protein/Tfp pilus assembly protein PilF
MSKELNRLYEFGIYRLDVENRVLLRNEQTVHLPPKAIGLLIVLVERNGQIVSKEQLMNLLWRDAIVEDANLTQHIFLLRKLFGEQVNGQKYIETIPRRGYRFVAEVKTLTPSANYNKLDLSTSPRIIEKHTYAEIITEAETEDLNESQPITDLSFDRPSQKLLTAGHQPLWKNWKAGVALLIFVLLTTTVTFIIYFNSSRQAEIKTVAVLPLRSLTPNEEDPSLGLKLADALIQQLGRLRQIVVRPTRAIQRYEGLTLDPIAAGREQQVDAVLDGSFQRAGERLHVRVQLLRTSDGKQVWARTFDEHSSDPFYLQDALAEQTAQALLPQLAGTDRVLVARHDTENIAAHHLYTEGRYYWNRRNLEGLERSITQFEKSIQLDPQYALAYAGLADAYITLSDYEAMPAKEAYPKAKAAALKALELDATLVEAHTSLAMIKASYEWDWPGADQAFKRAIELNPNYATTHQWYAEYLSGMGRHEEALAEIRRAQEIDPLSLIIRSVEAWIWYYARDYDQMIAQCQRVIEMDASFSEVYAYLGRAYEQKGMFREAMDAFQKYSTLMGYNTPEAASLRAAAILDAKDYWQKMVRLGKPPTGSEFEAAEAWSRLGESDVALDLLEQAFYKRDYHILYLKVHPNLDPLRRDARFQNLLRRTGLAS